MEGRIAGQTVNPERSHDSGPSPNDLFPTAHTSRLFRYEGGHACRRRHAFVRLCERGYRGLAGGVPDDAGMFALPLVFDVPIWSASCSPVKLSV